MAEYLKFKCSIEEEDTISFDNCLGQLGIDVYEEDKNIGVVLTKKNVEELITFLQNNLETLK